MERIVLDHTEMLRERAAARQGVTLSPRSNACGGPGTTTGVTPLRIETALLGMPPSDDFAGLERAPAARGIYMPRRNRRTRDATALSIPQPNR